MPVIAKIDATGIIIGGLNTALHGYMQRVITAGTGYQFASGETLRATRVTFVSGYNNTNGVTIKASQVIWQYRQGPDYTMNHPAGTYYGHLLQASVPDNGTVYEVAATRPGNS